ncbi:MAG: ABC transporter substrate-binding protein [Dehalococcoidia bacterium]|nr:ABC transporter substrate-binding protein [Dehalococcoidia bacterium]
MHRAVGFFPGLAGLLVALALTGCSAAATPPPLAPSGGADTGPVTPKVNRLVVAMPAPASEGNNPSRLSTPPIVAMKLSYEYFASIDNATGKFVPELATEWRLEPDGKSYRFKLRPGVQFHRGYGDMTSADWAHTMADLAHPESLHAYAGDYRTLIEKSDEVGPLEIVYRLTRPDAAFLSNISHQLSGLEIHSKKEFDEKGNPSLSEKASAGTGPYEFLERQQGAYVRWKKVDYKHWRVTPDFPEMELRWINEASTRLAGLLTGELHMAPLPVDLQAQAERGGLKIAKGTIPGVRLFLHLRGMYLNDIRDPSKGYKHLDSPIMDKRVRQALSKAVNRDELNKTLLGGKGETLILNHYEPKTRKAWNPDWEKRFPEMYGFDAAKARALLAEAGYGPAKPLNLQMVMVTLAEAPNSQDIQEAIANYWRNIGINVQLLTIDRAEDTRRGQALEWQAASSIFAAPSDQWTGVWVFNTYFNRASAPNAVQVPEIDTLFQKTRATLNEPEQEKLWRQMGDQIFDSFQHVPLFWLPVEMLYNPTIVGSYQFPGSVSGLYTKLETVKAAR